MKARYSHTNLVARDWRGLAEFYKRVLGCSEAGPERNLSGPALESATGVEGAQIHGVHLRLPGCGDSGPTLEIFEYQPAGPTAEPAIHRAGFAHIAFVVEDITASKEEVLAAGGKPYGDQASIPVPGVGVVSFIYLTDPEGNIIELQSWAK